MALLHLLLKPSPITTSRVKLAFVNREGLGCRGHELTIAKICAGLCNLRVLFDADADRRAEHAAHEIDN